MKLKLLTLGVFISIAFLHCTKKEAKENLKPISLFEITAPRGGGDLKKQDPFQIILNLENTESITSTQIIQTQIETLDPKNPDFPKQVNTLEIKTLLTPHQTAEHRVQFEEKYLGFRTSFKLNDDIPLIQDLSSYFKDKSYKYTLDHQKNDIFITGISQLREELKESLPEHMQGDFLSSFNVVRTKELLGLRHFLFFIKEQIHSKTQLPIIGQPRKKASLNFTYSGLKNLNNSEFYHFTAEPLEQKSEFNNQTIHSQTYGFVLVNPKTGFPYFYELKSESNITFEKERSEESTQTPPPQRITSIHQMHFN